MKQLTIHIDDDLHYRLKRYAAERAESMSDLIRDMLLVEVPEYDEPLATIKRESQQKDKQLLEEGRLDARKSSIIPLDDIEKCVVTFNK